MSDNRRPRAVLDADILYSRVLHELFGRLARELRLLDIFWSDELLAETQRSLVEKKNLPEAAASRWVDYLRQSFPSGRIEIDQTKTGRLDELTRDPGDHHICALVLAAHADYLFTHDHGYLHDELSGRGVSVQTPDDVLATAFDADPEGVVALLELQASTWAGGHPLNELIDAIERAKASRFARKVRAYLHTHPAES